jgi:hypothetical protein
MGTQMLTDRYLKQKYEKCLKRASAFICFYWYGHDVYFEPDSLIKKQFFAIAKRLAKLYKPKIRTIIENQNVIDVMWIIINDDKYCEGHQWFILVLAYTLFKEKRLYFSTFERKYTYMVKVSKISQHVIAEIKRRNKRDTWVELTGCAITCLLGYILS